MLHMEQVRRVMCPQVMFNIGQQTWRFIAGGLNHATVEPRQSLLHERLPGVLVAALGRLLQENVVALGVHRHQAKPPVNVSSCATVMSVAGMSRANRALSSRRYATIASST